MSCCRTTIPYRTGKMRLGESAWLSPGEPRAGADQRPPIARSSEEAPKRPEGTSVSQEHIQDGSAKRVELFETCLRMLQLTRPLVIVRFDQYDVCAGCHDGAIGYLIMREVSARACTLVVLGGRRMCWVVNVAVRVCRYCLLSVTESPGRTPRLPHRVLLPSRGLRGDRQVSKR